MTVCIGADSNFEVHLNLPSLKPSFWAIHFAHAQAADPQRLWEQTGALLRTQNSESPASRAWTSLLCHGCEGKLRRQAEQPAGFWIAQNLEATEEQTKHADRDHRAPVFLLSAGVSSLALWLRQLQEAQLLGCGQAVAAELSTRVAQRTLPASARTS